MQHELTDTQQAAELFSNVDAYLKPHGWPVQKMLRNYVELVKKVLGAATAAKDAEISALTAQLASFARGVKISIPTDTMEQEFQQHFKRGAASKDAEIAKHKLHIATLEQMLGHALDGDTKDAEMAALRQKASRYDWLRTSGWFVGEDNFYCSEGGTLYDCNNENDTPQKLDAAIDAAMAQAVQS